eukprot:TRINITY_DN5098_c0_g1_i4.p2 TRINITY_DN5098_c0_g1~~TRINITY_DN5098_c0_g1_i4.p2  ORF type:complete len:107 (+),score=6.42 TRINITY_DN5098_c0_g1_i4:70-390(+)
MTSAQSAVDTGEYKVFKGARVLWPPDCPDNILEEAIRKTHELLKVHNIKTDGAKIVQALKEHLDVTFEKSWHVVMGKNFGCYSVHEMRRFLFFYIDAYAFLMYKAG